MLEFPRNNGVRLQQLLGISEVELHGAAKQARQQHNSSQNLQVITFVYTMDLQGIPPIILGLTTHLEANDQSQPGTDVVNNTRIRIGL